MNKTCARESYPEAASGHCQAVSGKVYVVFSYSKTREVRLPRFNGAVVQQRQLT